MMINKLTEADFQAIDNYRKSYVEADSGDFCKSQYLLGLWDEAKSQYLGNIFKDELIITKPVEFKESVTEIETKMNKMFRDKRISNFCREIKDCFSIPYETSWDAPERNVYRLICDLFNPYLLSENRVSSYAFECAGSSTIAVPLKDGKELKVQKGAKPMRVLSKIVESYGIGVEVDEDGVSDFEYFRRKHSLALNQKRLTGDLCLSIHPLDYMTMSDNDEGWSSCMSWMDGGEYKQGTVEMLNSPNVVVAYLAADDRKIKWSRDNEWNSKKWRCLFIVDKDFIVNVKCYPYHNDELVKSAIKEIAKLSGWGDVEPAPYDFYNKYCEYHPNGRYKDVKPFEIDGHKVMVEFRTGAMYNDFGTNHWIAVNPNAPEEITNFDYFYSGSPQCMWCGTSDSDIVGYDYDTGSLACADCNPSCYCENCDCRVSPDELIETADGYRVCEYCFDQDFSQDVITGGYYHHNNLYTLYLSEKNGELVEYEPYCGDIFFSYDEVGTNSWHNLFKIDEPRKLNPTQPWYSVKYYVCPEDLTPAGLQVFDIWDAGSPEEAFPDAGWDEK
jgi:hypothetical protein